MVVSVLRVQSYDVFLFPPNFSAIFLKKIIFFLLTIRFFTFYCAPLLFFIYLYTIFQRLLKIRCLISYIYPKVAAYLFTLKRSLEGGTVPWRCPSGSQHRSHRIKIRQYDFLSGRASLTGTASAEERRLGLGLEAPWHPNTLADVRAFRQACRMYRRDE